MLKLGSVIPNRPYIEFMSHLAMFLNTGRSFLSIFFII